MLGDGIPAIALRREIQIAAVKTEHAGFRFRAGLRFGFWSRRAGTPARTPSEENLPLACHSA